MKKTMLVVGLVAAVVLSACGTSTDSTSQGAPAVQVDPQLTAKLPKSIQDSKVVKGASSFTTPPLYTFADDGKTPSGVLIELIENAAAHMGVKVDWQQIPYAGIVPALDSGKADLSGSQYSSTPENLGAANIVSVYRNTVALVVPTADKGKYGDLAGACGTRIAVVRGSTIEPPALAKIDAACRTAGRPVTQSTPFAGAADALTALKAGRVDGFMLSYASAVYNARQAGATFATVLGGQFARYPSGFAVAKSQTEVAAAFTAAFDASLKDGSYAAIMKKWNVPAEMYSDQIGLNVPAG